MPRGIDPRSVSADRAPGRGMSGAIPDFGWNQDWDDPLGRFIEGLLRDIKNVTGIDLYWMLDWSWTTNSLLELVRQANDLMAWLQNPIQKPPNLLSRPGFSSPSAIAEAPDWFWDAVISLGTLEGPYGVLRTDPQGSARTTADGSRHALMSNAVSDRSVLTPGQILQCQIHVLVEDGFTAADDEAIRLELVPSRLGVLQEPVVLASCGVPVGDPTDWIAAPVDSKAVFFDVDYRVPLEDSPDTIELRLVVDESAGGNVPVRFDGARVAAAGGFLVILADLFDAGRRYLTDLWDAVTAWLEDVFDADHWTALKDDTDEAFDVFVRRIKRSLRHADAEIFHPPSTSHIIADALKSNPWFGWLFGMVDSWLQPILNIGKAVADFGDAVWHAVTVFFNTPTAPGAWATLMAAITDGWNDLVDAILIAWGNEILTHEDFADPVGAITKSLRHNAWFGWLMDLVDSWLQPVLRVGKALTDFGDEIWHAITTFAGAPGASGAWAAMVAAIGSAWDDMVDAVLGAWGSSKTHEDFASPAQATEAAIKNNPVTGWLFGSTFEGGDWLSNALAPITGFFDQIRKYINQMIEALRWGYFDENWVWVASFTTPDTELPGSGPVMTPGSNDGDGGGLSPIADTSIPAAPRNVSAIPFWDITVSGFPAGHITYAIAAVKSGVEGPATQVKTYVSTLFPPNSSTHVDLRWDAVAGASSYRVYRKADGYSTTTPWRLVASPSSNGTLLAPVVDKTARASGTVAAPKTDAELSGSIVSTVKTTAGSAASTAAAASSAAGAAQTTAEEASSAALQAGNEAAQASALLEAIPESRIIIDARDPEDEDWGVTLLASGGATWKAPNGGGVQGGSVSWSQSVPAGAKRLFIFSTTADGSGPNSLSLTFSSGDPSVSSPVSENGNYFGDDRGWIGVRAAAVPVGWLGGSVTITATWSSSATGRAAVVDMGSIVVGGSASSDFEVITNVSGAHTAPADSLLVQFAGRFLQNTTVSAPGLFPSFTAARTTENQSSVQTGMTYGVGSRLATRNIDDATSVTYTAATSDIKQMLVVVKSIPYPGATVGSYARITTQSGDGNWTSASGVTNRPLAGYYTAVTRSSPDYDIDLGAGTITITYSGTYLVHRTAIASGDQSMRVVVNGDALPSGVVSRAANSNYLGEMGFHYLKAGDVLGLTLASVGTGSVSRGRDGSQNLALTLVNRSYL